MSINFVNIHSEIRKEDWINPLTIDAYEDFAINYLPVESDSVQNNERTLRGLFDKLTYEQISSKTILVADQMSINLLLEYLKGFQADFITHFLIILEHHSGDSLKQLTTLSNSKLRIKCIQFSHDIDELSHSWLGLPLIVTSLFKATDFNHLVNLPQLFLKASTTLRVPESEYVLSEYHKFLKEFEEKQLQSEPSVYLDCYCEVVAITNFADFNNIVVQKPLLGIPKLPFSKKELRNSLNQWFSKLEILKADFQADLKKKQKEIESFIPKWTVLDKIYSNQKEKLIELKSETEAALEAKVSELTKDSNLGKVFLDATIPNVGQLRFSLEQRIKFFPDSKVKSYCIAAFVCVFTLGFLFFPIQSNFAHFAFIGIAILISTSIIAFLNFTYLNEFKVALKDSIEKFKVKFDREAEVIDSLRNRKSQEFIIRSLKINLENLNNIQNKMDNSEGLLEYHKKTISSLNKQILNVLKILELKGVENKPSIQFQRNKEVCVLNMEESMFGNDYYHLSELLNLKKTGVLKDLYSISYQ